MNDFNDAPSGQTGGPAVWLDMDQRSLDDAYDQSVWAPRADQAALRREESCKRTLARLGAPNRLAYGASEHEKLTLFRSRRPNAPIFLFLHGGAWRGGSAAQTVFIAENILDAGAHFLSADFIDVVTAGGNLRPMAEQVRRAIAWTYLHAADFGGDPTRLFLCGHSSGAHLAGCALCADWPTLGLPPQPIRAALLSSGMYDLTPVRLSKRSAYVNFTDSIVEELSSIRHIDRIRTDVIMTHGSCESPEFQRQTRAMHAAMREAGKTAELRVGLGLDHFEIQETLGNPYGFLGRAARELMEAHGS